MRPARTMFQSVFLPLMLALSAPRAARSASDPAGISNEGKTPKQPYVAAGDRAYLIGTQDGDFPDMGGHVPGEMGGLWVHPIKLIDGFWASVADLGTPDVALTAGTEFINYPYGNRIRYDRALDSLDVERFQFAPDGQPGVIVQYEFANAAARARKLVFRLDVKTDLRPVWYSEHFGIRDSTDTVEWRASKDVFVARDAANRWYAVWGAASPVPAEPIAHPQPIRTAGLGVTAASQCTLSVAPHDSTKIAVVFAGSAVDSNAALAAYDSLARDHEGLLASKKARLATMLERARLSIPDRRLQDVFDWARVDIDWCVRDVPGIGRGVGAGLMEYPWWFGTETYTLQALVDLGEYDLVRQTLRLLAHQSMKANGNGRIPHEITTNGAVANPGNTQETAQFIMTVGKLVRWSGDLAFAKEMYPAVKLGLHWLLTGMDLNHDLFPEGYGIMEVYGLNAELIDVAVYTQQALEEAANLARCLNDRETAVRYEQQAAELKAKINERFWLDADSSYADFYGTREQAISAAAGAIHQIELQGTDKLTPRDRELIGTYERMKQRFAALPPGSRGWLTNRNWVISTPMEMGIAPRDRALRLLEKVRTENTGPYGPYLSATDRQAMMTISTGVQAVAEFNYGRVPQAMAYVNEIAGTFGRVLPGSISEMMPDYGCFTIAWTAYGIVVPLVEHVFGVHADALAKTVVFDPQVPAGWNKMSLENLPIGGNVVSFSRDSTQAGIEYAVHARESDWTFALKGSAVSGAKCYLNGKPVAITSSGIRMSGRENRVLVVR